MAKLFLLFLLAFLIFPMAGFAAGDIGINEIAWMGTSESANNEWVELYNKSAGSVDINGWQLETADGGVTVTLEGIIPAGGFFLLERTDDESVKGVPADQLYVGPFSNTGEIVIVKNKNGNEVDKIDATSGWPAGDNTTKDTMQRSATGWISAPATPKAANASVAAKQKEDEVMLTPVTAPSPAPVQEVRAQAQPTIIKHVMYPTTFFISEFFPDPKGADGEGEWIEIYNASDKAESVAGFFLDDAEGGSRAYQIPQGVSISSKGYAVFKRQETKLALNNISDEVRLLYPNKSLAAYVAYADAKEGLAGAYDIANGKVYWTSVPTPGTSNVLTSATILATASPTKPYQEQAITSLDALPPASLSATSASSQFASPLPLRKAGSMDNFWGMLFALLLGAGAMFGYLRFFKKAHVVLFALVIFAVPFFVSADTFPVLRELDSNGRSQIEADVARTGTHSLVYVERGITISPQIIQDIGAAFDDTIYPQLVDLFGSPFDAGFPPGPINLLFANITMPEGGYFISTSRNIIYINKSFVDTTSKVKGIIAHELQHMIAYAQKNVRLELGEDRWINEMRSEYASTYSGFGEKFLKERLGAFKSQPFGNLVIWQDLLQNYGMVSMFGHFLAARFGDDFYRKEIHSSTVGRASAGRALKQFDPALTFAKVYADWRLANYINDASILKGKYSYKNNLIDVRLNPEASASFTTINDPPKTITTIISSYNSGAVNLFFGGNRAKVTFTTPDTSADLVVSYLKQDQDGTFADGQLTLENGQAAVSFAKGTKAAIFLMANVADNIGQTVFTLNAQIVSALQPVITALDPVILSSNAINTKYFARGQNFENGASVTVNGQAQDSPFLNDKTLLVSIDPQVNSAQLVVTNPDGQSSMYTWQRKGAMASTQASSISDGSLLQASNDYKVYSINNGFRRHIISSSIFSFYGHLNPSRVNIVDPSTLGIYKESNLIRAAGEEEVYEIFPNGTKRWIQTAQDFVARGFDWNAIFEINTRELNFYPTVG